MSTFTDSVDHYCEGLTIAVGCLGEQCEHAKQESDDVALHSAVWDLLNEWHDVTPSTLAIHLGDEVDEIRIAFENRDEDHQCEAHFSSSQCDSCGSTFAGDREEAWGIPYITELHTDWPRLYSSADPIKLSICVDCMMYHANGEEPETWQQHPSRFLDIP